MCASCMFGLTTTNGLFVLNVWYLEYHARGQHYATLQQQPHLHVEYVFYVMFYVWLLRQKSDDNVEECRWILEEII